mmetsp:Transcript_27069/g.52757  ORF Transcript_27069/g.52757 Transcript_27069/m.52757 type:complete len:272 (-) Transcript_27069:242-1057(-)
MRRGAPVLITQSRTISPPPLATVVNMKHAASATSACFGCALITITNDDIMSLFKAPRGLTFRSQIQARATDPLTATATSPGLARRDLTRPSSAVCHSSSSSSSSSGPAMSLLYDAWRRRKASVSSTVMMGQTEAHARMPKPSGALTALEKPIPVESTKGTVTGPVVTPAQSHAMLMKSSLAKSVSKTAMAYLAKTKKISPALNRILVDPTAMPIPTPTHTAYTRREHLKLPLLRRSTVCPTTFSAGSARVARKPRRNIVHSTSAIPPVLLL